MMTMEQFKKMKPTFKKLISQEITKMVSRGIHQNRSIRDVIKNQDLEEKAIELKASRRPIWKKNLPVATKMNQSKLLKLLYDTSSQESSQISYFGMTEENEHLQTSTQQAPIGEQPGMFGPENGQFVVSSMPQNIPQMGEMQGFNGHQQQMLQGQPLYDNNGNL